MVSSPSRTRASHSANAGAAAPIGGAATEWTELASEAKTTMFQLARLMRADRVLDLEALLGPMQRRWDTAMEILVDLYA